MSGSVGTGASAQEEADFARWRRCGVDPAMLAPELILQLRRFRPAAPAHVALRPKPVLQTQCQRAERERLSDCLLDGEGPKQRVRCLRDCIAALRRLTQMSSMRSRPMEFEQLREAIIAFIGTI